MTGLGAVQSGISFGASKTDDYRPGLDLVPPLVRVDPAASTTDSGIGPGCVASATGASAYLSGSGYLRATAAGMGVPGVECRAE